MVTSPVGSVFLKDIVQSSIAGAICVSIIKQFYRKEGHNGVFASVQVLQELAEMFSHPLKTRSIMCGSLPVFMVPLIIFSDDTSGNRSKVWNKFDSWCFLLAGLRQKDNAQFCNIHFICTSNQVPVMEMTHPLVDQLLELERGIVVFDAQLNTNALILAPVICFLCDNPRAAEICSHLGSGTLRFCRICRVDHTNSLTGICEERKRSSTIQEVQLIRSAHTQAERKRLRTLYGTSEENHLLQLPVDLHQSTPIESLHTLGLGPYKYLLREKMEQLSEKQRKEVVARIAALPSSGLTGGISSDISRHYKSFVGRDFKFLAQIAMFIFSPYLSEAEIEVWLALSMVFKMVYCDEFESQKIELYRDVCHRFARAIDCYSVTWRKILKIHLILHLPDSMLRFGPASSFNTERCGEDLVNLYHTKEVQAFLGGEVQKPRTKAPLASVPITLEGKTMSLEEIDAKFTVLLPHGISNLTPVQWGRATVGKNGQLINVQDYIEYNSQASTLVELETGLFIGSFHTEQATFCLVRYLEPVLMAGTEPVLNEWSCPLLTLTNVIRCIASTLVSCAVSVVHQCDSQCVLAEQETTSRIERELVTQKKTVFVHNTDNNMYCCNIFYGGGDYTEEFNLPLIESTQECLGMTTNQSSYGSILQVSVS
ncbi:hypothetical protein EMCRGX_G001015 [Ephydatia muelleri]